MELGGRLAEGAVPGPKPTGFCFGFFGWLVSWFYVVIVLGPEPTQGLVDTGPKHCTGVGKEGRGYAVPGSEPTL